MAKFGLDTVVGSKVPAEAAAVAEREDGAAKAESKAAHSDGDVSQGREHNVYVKNFGPEVTQEKLEAMFKEFGEIVSCTVLRDHHGNSKQVGFVQFTCDEDAARSIAELHGKEGYGTKPLHVALTAPKPVRTVKRTNSLDSSLMDSPSTARSPAYGRLGQSFVAMPFGPMPRPGGPGMFPGEPVSWQQVPGGSAPMMMYPPYPFYANTPFIGVKPAVMPGYDIGNSQPVLLGMRAPAHSGSYAPMPIMQPGQHFMMPFAGPQQPVYPLRPCRFPSGNFMPAGLVSAQEGPASYWHP